MKYLLLLILSACVSSCTDPTPIGTIKTYYDWDCVKRGSSSGLGISSGGSLVSTSHSYCAIYKCREITIKTQKWINDITYGKIVDDSLCIGEP